MIGEQRRLVLDDQRGRKLIEVEMGIIESNQIWMRAQLNHSAQIEAVIQSAIKHKVQRLDLTFFSGGTYCIPNSIGEISSLEELNLDGGCNAYGLQEIPSSVGKLSNLKRLLISEAYYQLEYLPESIGNLMKLEELYIGSCSKLKEIPSSIGQLKKLKRLEILESMYPLASLESLP